MSVLLFFSHPDKKNLAVSVSPLQVAVNANWHRSHSSIRIVIERGNFMVIITVVACHYYSVCSQKVKFNSLFIPKFLRSHFSSSFLLQPLPVWVRRWMAFFSSFQLLVRFVFISFWITECDAYLDGCFLASVKPFPFWFFFLRLCSLFLAPSPAKRRRKYHPNVCQKVLAFVLLFDFFDNKI